MSYRSLVQPRQAGGITVLSRARLGQVFALCVAGLLSLGGNAQAAGSTAAIGLDQFTPSDSLNQYWFYMDSTAKTGDNWASASMGKIAVGTDFTVGSGTGTFHASTFVGRDLGLSNAGFVFDSSLQVVRNAVMTNGNSPVVGFKANSVFQVGGNLTFGGSGFADNAPTWIGGNLTPSGTGGGTNFNKEIHILGELNKKSGSVNYHANVYFHGSTPGQGLSEVPVARQFYPAGSAFAPPYGTPLRIDSAGMPGFATDWSIPAATTPENVNDVSYEDPSGTGVCATSCVSHTSSVPALGTHKILPPGYYGTLTIDNGTVFLGEGVYVFDKININQGSAKLIAIQTNGGRTIVYAKNGLTTANVSSPFVGPEAAYGASGYGFGPGQFAGGTMMLVAGRSANLTFGNDCKVWATLSAPTGTIDIKQQFTLYGQMFARHFQSGNNFNGGSGMYVPFNPKVPKITISIAPSGATVNEDDVLYYAKITLSQANAYNVSFKYRTLDTLGSTAIADVNYVKRIDSVVTIDAGKTSVDIPFRIKWDHVYTGNRDFYLNFAVPTAAVFALGSGVVGDSVHAIAKVIILEKDPAFTASVADASLIEGNTGTTTMGFTVRLVDPATGASVNAAGPVAIAWHTEPVTSGVIATAGTDYTEVISGTATIVAGSSSTSLPVSIFGDLLNEANESFKVVIDQVSTGGSPIVLGASAHKKLSAVGTITNDDALPTVSFVSATSADLESKTSRTFTVTLSAASGLPVSVDWATGDDVTVGANKAVVVTDYDVTFGTLDFAQGETSKIITVTTKNDNVVEPNETFAIKLSGPTNANLGGIATHINTIVNNDLSVTATASNKVYDGSPNATISAPVLTGVRSGDAVTVSAGAATFASKNVGTGIAVSVATPWVLGGADAAKYELVTIPVLAANITVKVLTVSGVSALDKPYDGTPVAMVNVGTLGGKSAGDAVSLIYTSAAFDTKNVGTAKPVTVTGWSLSGADASNYSLPTIPALTAAITAKALTVSGVSASNKAYDGTTVATVNAGTLGGKISGDAVSLTFTSAAFDTKNVGTAKPVTVTGWTLSGADASNYSLPMIPALTANITAKALTVSGVSASDKAYDGSAVATVNAGTLGGKTSGDAVSLTFTSAAFDTKNVGTAKPVTVTGWTLSGADALNYSLPTIPALTANITAKALTVSGVSASDKAYDGTAVATVNAGTLGGKTSGDAVSLTFTSAAFDTKNVGTAKPVTVTGWSLSGADALNYSLPTIPALTANITAKALTVSGVSAADKPYDGTTVATVNAGTLGGKTSGDAVSLTFTSAAFDTKNVGTAKLVTVTGWTLSGADASNYSLPTIPALTANITAKALTVSGVSASDKAYDGTAVATVNAGTLGGKTSGDAVSLTFTSAAFDTKNVGTAKPVTVTGWSLSGADASNYSLPTLPTLIAAITTKPVTVTADAKSKAYGMPDPVLTWVATGLVGSDALAGSLSRAAGESVGTYAITGIFTNPNYAVSFTGADLAITKKVVTVSAKPQSKTYGDLDPALSYDVSGLEAGDALTGNLSRIPGETVGEYAIGQGSLASPNYAIGFTGNTLTIAPKAVTVTVDANAKVYGSTDPILTYVATGLVGPDTLTGNLTRTAGEDVGNYAIGKGSLANANYVISFVPGNLAITAKSVTVTVDGQVKTYGTTDPSLSYKASGLVGSDLLSGSLVRDAGESAGRYAIKQGSLAHANYAISFVPDSLTITTKPVTVTADAKSKAYGMPDPVLTWVATGLVGSDALAGSLSRAAGESVGTYAITGIFTNPNYAVSFTGADLAITKKVVTVSAKAQSKTYGDPDPSLTYDVSGLEGSDVLTGSLSRIPGETVGEYAIGQGSLASPNYAIGFTGSSLAIAPKTVAVTVDAKSKTYGMTDPVLTYVATGLVGPDTLSGNLVRTAGEDVGSYAIEKGSLANANYVISVVPENLTITAKTVTVTVDGQVKTYGMIDPSLSYKTTGLVGSDLLSGSLVRDAGESAGRYAIKQGSLAHANYAISFVPDSLTITTKPVTVTADAKSKSYGMTDPVLTYVATGLVGSDTLAGSLSRAAGESVGTYAITGNFTNPNYAVSFTDADLAITKKVVTVSAKPQSKTYGDLDPALSYDVSGLEVGDALTGNLSRIPGETVGEYAIGQGSLASPNYAIGFTGNTLTIAPKPVTVTVDVKSKVYGMTDPVLTFVATGLVGPDTLTGNLVRTAGEDVGSYAIEKGSLANANYVISVVPENLTITAKTVTVTVDGQVKTYGMTDPSLSYKASGLVGSDLLSGSLVRDAGESAGRYAIKQGTLAHANYAISFVPDSLIITTKPVTVTADAKSKAYGMTDPVLTWVATGLVGSDTLAGSLTRAAGESVGTYAITGDFTNPNYAVSFMGADLAITKKVVTVSAKAQSKTYGDPDPSLTYDVSGLEGSDVLTGSLSRIPGETVGEYAIGQGSLASPNYAIGFTGSTLAIAPKAVTVTVDAKSKTYGMTDPVLTYVATGLVGPDTLSGNLTRIAGEDVGIYAIEKGSLANANYVVSYTGADLSIVKASVSVVADAQTKKYGAADPVLTWKAVGLVGSDTLTGGLTRSAGESVGNYAIASTLDNPNYAVSYTGADLSIVKASVSVVADAQTKNYGAADPVLTWKAAGLVGSDTLTGGLTRATGESVGNYAIASTLDNPNYVVTYTGADLSIVRKSLAVGGASVESKVYDGSTVATIHGALLSGLVGTDAVTLVVGTASFDTKDAGMAKPVTVSGSVLSGADASNYELVEISGLSADILPKSLSVLGATVQDKVYDGGVSATMTGASLSGLVGSDVVTLIPGTASFATKDTGTAKAVTVTGSKLSGADAGNYALPGITGLAASITAREVRVHADAKLKTYGAADPAWTAQDTGLVAGDVLSGAMVRADGESVGKYAIGQGTLSAGSNYLLRFFADSLTIRPLTVAIFDTSVSEGVGMVNVRLTLSDPAIMPITVLVRAHARTATLDSLARVSDAELDTVSVYPVTFAPGTTVASFSLHVLDDGRVEDAETLILTLSGNQAVPSDSARVAIVDNDARPVVKLTNPTEGQSLGKKDLTTEGKVPAGWTLDGKVQIAFDTLVAEGPATIVKCFTDEWGNVGCDSAHVVVDTTAPTVLITSISKDGGKTWIDVVPGVTPWVNKTDILVKWISIDGKDTVRHQDSEHLKDSLNVVTRTAADALGNQAWSTVTVGLDTIAPAVRIVTPPAGSHWSSQKVAMVWTEQDGDRVIRHDSLVPTDLPGPMDLKVCSAPDRAGNVGCAWQVIQIDANQSSGAVYVDTDHDGRIDAVIVQFPRAWTGELPTFSVAYGGPGEAAQAGLTAVYGEERQAGTVRVIHGDTVRVLAGTPVLDPAGNPVVGIDGAPMFQSSHGTPLLDPSGKQVLDTDGVPLWKVDASSTQVDSSVLVVKLTKPFPYGWTSSTLSNLGTLEATVLAKDSNGTVVTRALRDTFDIRDGVPPVILESRILRTESYGDKDTLVIQLSEAATVSKLKGTGVFEISKDSGRTWVAVEIDSLSVTGSIRILLDPGEPGSPRPGTLIRIAGNINDVAGNGANAANTPWVTVIGAPRPDLVTVTGPTTLLDVTLADGERTLAGPLTFLASRFDTASSEAYQPGVGYVSSDVTRSVCPDLQKCATTTVYVNRPSSIQMFIYDQLGTYVARTSFFLTKEDLEKIQKDKLDRTRLQIVWNLRDTKGRQVSTGVYLVRMLIRYTDDSRIDSKMDNYILRYGVRVQ